MRSAQAFSAVPAPKILGRAEGNDASGIDLIMRHVIMPFDVIEIHGRGDAVILVEIFEITEEIIVIDETPEIAFEMSVVHGIEANERDEQAPIRLHEARPEEVPL